MAGRPYVSSRSGRFQWMMQRASALLLIFFAFFHFGLQHFTAEAVSTGLTVAERMNNPFWQSYYIVFIVLAMYHGVNGIMGIAFDYAPKPLARGLIALGLWTAAAIFGAIGLANILTPQPVSAVKQYYTEAGFAAGESQGPSPLSFEYSFRTEVRELQKFAYYLEHHTALAGGFDPASIFGALPEGKSADDAEVITLAGDAFDAWVMATISAGPPEVEDRDRSELFSSAYELAVWAGNVRKVNAEHRLKVDANDARAQAVVDHLTAIPAYTANLF